MAHLLVKQRIEDISKWRAKYEDTTKKILEEGCLSSTVYRDEKTDTFYILQEWDTEENARTFAQSEDLKELLKSGSQDTPVITYLNKETQQQAVTA